MPERRFSLSLPAQVRSQTQRYLASIEEEVAFITACPPLKPVFYPSGAEKTRLPVGNRIDQQIKSKRLENMVDYFENVRVSAKLAISPFGHLQFVHQLYPQRWQRWVHKKLATGSQSSQSSQSLQSN